MTRIQISRDPSGPITVSFPYGLVLVSKVKTIEGRRWYPEEKHWSFLDIPILAPCGPRRARLSRRGSELAPYSIIVRLYHQGVYPKYILGMSETYGQLKELYGNSD
jgi:hypothetical protein